MKYLAMTFILLLGVSISAQQPTPQSTPQPTPQATPDAARQIEAERQQMLDQRRQGKFNSDQLLGGKERDAEFRSRAAGIAIAKLYRKTTDAELAFLAPDPTIYAKYAEFLKKSGTGVVRLVSLAGCANDGSVINVSPRCLQYSMPGGGNSYSFRKRDYRIRRLSEVTFANDRFDVSGLLAHGVLVNLGSVDLAALTLRSAGTAFLVNFTPAASLESARQMEKTLARGVDADGFHYQSNLPVANGSTYLLRSIAYSGVYPRAVDGTVFDEFQYDRRVDTIVAFAVVRRDPDGSVTIIWREMSHKRSPTLKLPKEVKGT